MEWLYQRDPFMADARELFEPVGSGVSLPLYVRVLEWADPVLRGGVDLPGEAVFTLQNGVWASSDPTLEIVEDAATGMHTIRIVDGSATPRFFFARGMIYK